MTNEVIMLILHICGVLMEMITLGYLCKIVLGKNQKGLKKTLLVYGAISPVLIVISVISTVSWQRMLGYFLILWIPMTLYEGRWILKIFLEGIFLAIAGGSEILTKALFITLNGDFAAFTLQNSWGKFAQGLIISKFLAFVIVIVMSALQKVQKHQTTTRAMLAFSILPLTTILAINQLMNTSYVIDRQEVYAMTFLIVALLVLANVVLFYIFEKQAENEQTKLRLALLQQQQNEQEKFYAQLAAEKKKVNTLAHDLDKYLTAMTGYILHQQDEKVLSILQNLKNDLHDAQCHYTGDVAIDTVIAEKEQLAKQQGAKFQVRNLIQSPLLADGIEIGVLLANALDNALEATVHIPDAVIDLKIAVDENCIDIILKNTLDHDVQITNNTIATSKTDKTQHGLGLTSIQEIAERYDGNMELRADKGQFILDVMMMNRAK